MKKSIALRAVRTVTAGLSLVSSVAPLVTGGMFLAAPRACYARQNTTPASTSTITGVALPKNAAKVLDADLEAGLGRLMAAGAKEFHLPPGEGGNAEVYFWSGSAYKPGRAPFMQTMLVNTLTEAGYTVKKIDPSYENTPNAFDEDAYATGALQLTPADARHAYFHATNVEKKETIVDVWFDQPSQNRLVLALGRVGFGGGPTITKVPTVTDPNLWIVKDLKDATKGMPAPPLPVFPKLAGKPGTVRGRVLDGSGKPIAGAQIIAWASAAGGFRTSAKGRTNAQGIYEIPLPTGICQVVNADCHVDYNGKSILLPLYPADGERDDFPSNSGHIENFVLRTSGATEEGGGTYGAPMRVLDWNIPGSGVIEVTLKPVGTLLDGTRGKTLIFRYPVKTGLSGETFFGNIPIGRYTLTAKVYDGDDALPLRVRKTFGENNEGAGSLDVVFEDKGGNLASLGQSGIERFDVTIEP